MPALSVGDLGHVPLLPRASELLLGGEVVFNVFNPPLLLAGVGLLAPLGKCNRGAGKGCCYFILSPSGQGGGTDGAGVAWGGFFPGCQVKQVGSDSHLMLQPFTATLAT